MSLAGVFRVLTDWKFWISGPGGILTAAIYFTLTGEIFHG